MGRIIKLVTIVALVTALSGCLFPMWGPGGGGGGGHGGGGGGWGGGGGGPRGGFMDGPH
ncbi:hypothetical protein [Pantoea sp. B65]|uniref:hypothetical protein n=1 Tax=Pantoea sp. B65 TaxID=2813359 RepID=UPI0039B3E903